MPARGPTTRRRYRFACGSDLPDDLYVFDSADHAASLFNLQTFGNVSPRSNPATAYGGARRCFLEGGRAALALATGQAAETAAVLTLCKQGDEIVSSSALYGGTYALFEVNLRNLGINTTFVNPDDPQNFKKALTKKTKLLYAETIGNPQINVLDIEAVAAIAKDAGIPLVIDNTFASPASTTSAAGGCSASLRCRASNSLTVRYTRRVAARRCASSRDTVRCTIRQPARQSR